jgi:hypothetical protein
MLRARTNDIAIPAKAGLRRQDAEANAEGGPKGRPQERPVIQPFAAMQSWIPAFAGMTKMECVPRTRE